MQELDHQGKDFHMVEERTAEVSTIAGGAHQETKGNYRYQQLITKSHIAKLLSRKVEINYTKNR